MTDPVTAIRLLPENAGAVDKWAAKQGLGAILTRIRPRLCRLSFELNCWLRYRCLHGVQSPSQRAYLPLLLGGAKSVPRPEAAI